MFCLRAEERDAASRRAECALFSQSRPLRAVSRRLRRSSPCLPSVFTPFFHAAAVVFRHAVHEYYHAMPPLPPVITLPSVSVAAATFSSPRVLAQPTFRREGLARTSEGPHAVQKHRATPLTLICRTLLMTRRSFLSYVPSAAPCVRVCLLSLIGWLAPAFCWLQLQDPPPCPAHQHASSDSRRRWR